MQPVATGGRCAGPENCGNKPKPLPWVATACDRTLMARRGSTVRVRQRALQKRRKRRFLLSAGVAESPVCGWFGALYGALRFRRRSQKGQERRFRVPACTAVAAPVRLPTGLYDMNPRRSSSTAIRAIAFDTETARARTQGSGEWRPRSTTHSFPRFHFSTSQMCCTPRTGRRRRPRRCVHDLSRTPRQRLIRTSVATPSGSAGSANCRTPRRHGCT